ncbi:cation:proton antiporter [Luteolibacter yonseiensis]|uniref:Cation:proton antiporter n=1 Tax=Luteolibacter yonseiensis TaxID=1144680 RepID=A0A934R3J8_9BACT|nr:cation:proton antiporter [Luteolibacter yonseiensis]MBK1816192.1 cation:proton antiporter [Luteolibacter yonseiensis]
MNFEYSPLTGFAIVMALIILLPRLMERLRLPAVLGFILTGILVGPAFFGVVEKDGPVITLLAEIGKLLFMFFVGFEIDLELFKKTRNRSMVFGFLTFIIPMVLGVALGRAFGYGWTAAILIGSIISSHTLLAYPILQRLGVVGNAAVAVTVSGTIFTDIAAMLVLAVAISIHQTGFSVRFLLIELVELAVFVPLVMFGLSKVARKAIIRYGQTPEVRVMVMLVVIVVAAEAARVIQLEGIVGAFLAGISLKRALRGKFAVEQLEVLAHSLFIPSFFLATGFLVDFAVMKQTILTQPLMVAGLLAATFGGKALAAWLTGLRFRFTRAETVTMASLSFPQMAATLASAVVGYEAFNAHGERLLDAGFVNAVVMLVIVSCVVGPILTARSAPRISGAPQVSPAAPEPITSTEAPYDAPSAGYHSHLPPPSVDQTRTPS